jgi:hypothetical protein
MNDILAILEARTTAMTIPEVSELLQIEPATLYRHARNGKLPTFRIAGVIRVNPAALATTIRATSLPRHRESARK